MKRLVATLMISSAALPVWAAEGTGEGFLGLSPLFWKSANFILFFGLLFYLLVRPLSRFFHSRRTQIDAQMKESVRQQQEAERLREEMEQRIAALSGEVAALRERMLREGERERDDLQRQGDAEATRLVAQIELEARRRVEAARRDLAADAAEVAAQLALELLQREMTPEDRERIFRTTLDHLRARHEEGAR